MLNVYNCALLAPIPYDECSVTQCDQLIKSDIRKPIDKSLSIDKIMLINIDCISQSMKISIFFFPKSIDFIDFIDKRKSLKNALHVW